MVIVFHVVHSSIKKSPNFGEELLIEGALYSLLEMRDSATTTNPCYIFFRRGDDS